MTEIVIYTAKDGHIQLDVNLIDETVWLTLAQMAQLFARDKSVISRHLNNVFKINELNRNSVVAKYATTASDGKTYQVEYFNLDAIISVGYRVNSKEGVKFRKWATQILKEHIIKGYTTNQKRLSERGISELEQTIKLLQKTLVRHELVTDLGQEAVQIIIAYAKSWNLLLAYDEEKLELPKRAKTSSQEINYQTILTAIKSLKTDLYERGEATALFGQDNKDGLNSILNNIEQTFDGEPLYKTVVEKAAHLLYFIIKDHPFVDGNKRIGSFMFLLYLRAQNIPIKINDNGLVALALLVAESDRKQKDLIVRLIVNLIID